MYVYHLTFLSTDAEQYPAVQKFHVIQFTRNKRKMKVDTIQSQKSDRKAINLVHQVPSRNHVKGISNVTCQPKTKILFFFLSVGMLRNYVLDKTVAKNCAITRMKSDNLILNTFLRFHHRFIQLCKTQLSRILDIKLHFKSQQKIIKMPKGNINIH